MSAWRYRAVAANGAVINGELAATTEAELDGRLAQIGLQLVTCKPARRGVGRRRISRRELINFCFHLGQSQKAGLPMLEALADLRDSTENEAFRNTLAAVSVAVEGGKALSEAMDDHPATFEPVFTSLIKAGEQSGEIAKVLDEMTRTLKWQDELASQTRKLLMYPAFVGTVVMAVVFFLMLYVVPQMSEFLKNMGQEMPMHTRALIATSEFIMNWWYLVLAAPFVFFFGLRFLLDRSLRVRYAVDELKIRAWVIGPILEKIVMSRFINYFQIMYASGISIVDALKTARDLAGNVVIANALEQVSQLVEQGNSLSISIQKVGVFPPLVVRMMKMGEDIGQLGDALLNVTYFYSREVEDSVEKLQSMIEPAMTVILGLILGWVMLSVLGPIYDVIGNLAI